MIFFWNKNKIFNTHLIEVRGPMAEWYSASLYQASGPGIQSHIGQGLITLLPFQRIFKISTKTALGTKHSEFWMRLPPKWDIFFAPSESRKPRLAQKSLNKMKISIELKFSQIRGVFYKFQRWNWSKNCKSNTFLIKKLYIFCFLYFFQYKIVKSSVSSASFWTRTFLLGKYRMIIFCFLMWYLSFPVVGLSKEPTEKVESIRLEILDFLRQH